MIQEKNKKTKGPRRTQNKTTASKPDLNISPGPISIQSPVTVLMLFHAILSVETEYRIRIKSELTTSVRTRATNMLKEWLVAPLFIFMRPCVCVCVFYQVNHAWGENTKKHEAPNAWALR